MARYLFSRRRTIFSEDFTRYMFACCLYTPKILRKHRHDRPISHRSSLGSDVSIRYECEFDVTRCKLIHVRDGRLKSPVDRFLPPRD